jgi:hypothetical protein
MTTGDDEWGDTINGEWAGTDADPRLVLGHLLVLLRNDILEQGGQINRDSVIFMLEEVGVMQQHRMDPAMFRNAPLAVVCMNEWLATVPEEWG